MTRLAARLLVVLLLASSTGGALLAQAQSGNLYGTVHDDSGAHLPGVTVVLTGVGAPATQFSDVFFPGSGAQFEAKFDPAIQIKDWVDFVVKSGRVLVWPIYKSTFERQDEWKVGRGLKNPGAFRDHLIMWSKDLRRSLDYLETRPELDRSKFAYLGFSWGALLAPVHLALDDRFKTAVMSGGGFWYHPYPPEAETLNFVTRVKTPVLMLNGRYDSIYPYEASQLPFFRLLGTPDQDKRHLVYEAGHGVPWKELVRETLAWLDKYLGPVKR